MCYSSTDEEMGELGHFMEKQLKIKVNICLKHSYFSMGINLAKFPILMAYLIMMVLLDSIHIPHL